MTVKIPPLPRRGDPWVIDPEIWLAHAEAHVEVHDRAAGSVPFVRNAAQCRIFADPSCAIGPGVTVSIKSRQVGSTTWWLVWIVEAMLWCPGIVCVFAVPDTYMGRIQAKMRVILRTLDEAGILPERRRDNVESLEFAETGSRLAWVSSGKSKEKAADTGVGDTVNLCVLSEFGRWKYGDEAFDAIHPAVEKARGALVIDSTPPDIPGLGAGYIRLARHALSGADPEWRALVLPWWLVPGYRAPSPADPSTFTREEQRLVDLHDLDPFQIEWRRRKIGAYGPKFWSIYVETAELAIVPPENRVWDRETLLELSTRRDAGDWPPPLTPEEVRRRLGDLCPPTASPLVSPQWLGAGPWGGHGQGYVRVWHAPTREVALDLPAVVGVDPSEGLPRGDAQAIVVIDGKGRVAATARLRVDPVVLAGIVQALATWYGAQAEVVLEMSSTYRIVERSLSWAMPPQEVVRVAAHPVLLEAYAGPVTLQSAGRKADRVSSYRDAITSGLWPGDPWLLDEMTQHDPSKGKASSRRGDDDMLDALGIAWLHRQELAIRKATAGQGTGGASFERREPRPGKHRWR